NGLDRVAHIVAAVVAPAAGHDEPGPGSRGGDRENGRGSTESPTASCEPAGLLRHADSPSPEVDGRRSAFHCTLLMVVLGVDTATADVVVGVTAGGSVIREIQVGPAEDGRPRHSKLLLPEIERSVDAVGGWGRI